MKNLLNCRPLAGTFAAVITTSLLAAGPAMSEPGASGHHSGNGHHAHRPDSHAPIGVMGEHMHKKGEGMLSYRAMRMEMDGNRIGSDSVSPETIATTVPNRFFGRPMQPPTLRVVPTRMTMDMHMFGMMYAPTNNLTLMAMVNYIEKEMDHVTFRGPRGTTRRGTFTTKSEGIGDT